jgi:hypothetical protein
LRILPRQGFNISQDAKDIEKNLWGGRKVRGGCLVGGDKRKHNIKHQILLISAHHETVHCFTEGAAEEEP